MDRLDERARELYAIATDSSRDWQACVEHMKRILRDVDRQARERCVKFVRDHGGVDGVEALVEKMRAGVESGSGPNNCVRCGAPYLPHGQYSRHAEGCQGGRGENPHKAGSGPDYCDTDETADCLRREGSGQECAARPILERLLPYLESIDHVHLKDGSVLYASEVRAAIESEEKR